MVKVAFYSVDINREGKIDHKEFDKFYELRNQDCSAAKVCLKTEFEFFITSISAKSGRSKGEIPLSTFLKALNIY